MKISGCFCLNAKKENAIVDLLSRKGSVESDCDAELLLSISFSGIVNVDSILISSLNDGRAPKTIKLFLNNPNHDFESAKAQTPAQTVHLNESDWKKTSKQSVSASSSSTTSKESELPSSTESNVTALIKLNIAKFSKVTSLTLYFTENMGSEETTLITGINVIGTSNKKLVVVEDVIE